ncbi:MAG: amidohydrolase [Clostridia bacterium]|nr:amidohydrolase [Clostridia bacterium]
MKTLLKNARILTMDDQYTEYASGWLLTEDGYIAALGESNEPDADEVIDCGGGILLPGFVNLHCHASMIPFRTMGDDCPDRLRRFLFPLEQEAWTKELTYLGARYAIAEMLLSGITAMVDMYYYEDEVARACLEMGMRGYLGETVICQRAPGSDTPEDALALSEALLEKYADSEWVHPILAPHGTTTVSAAILQKCQLLAEKYDTLLTLHACEMDDEMRYFSERGMTPVSYLDSLGLCGPRLLAVHCIHLTKEDIALLARRGARIAHCPGSNTKAGKGIAPMRDAAKAGIPFGFGTDGASSGNTLSLFDQMRLFAVCQKTKYHDRSLFPAKEIVRAATRGGAEALGIRKTGVLCPGFRADVTLVGIDRPSLFPLYDPYSALVYGACAAAVRLVMTGGTVRVRDGKLAQMDINKLRCELEKAMPPFRAAAEKYAAAIRAESL